MKVHVKQISGLLVLVTLDTKKLTKLKLFNEKYIFAIHSLHSVKALKLWMKTLK